MSVELKRVKVVGEELIIRYAETETPGGKIQQVYISNIDPIIYVVKKTASDFELSFKQSEQMIEKLLKEYEKRLEGLEEMGI